MASQALSPIAAKVVVLALRTRQSLEQAAAQQFTADVAPIAQELGVAPDAPINYHVEPSGEVTASWADITPAESAA